MRDYKKIVLSTMPRSGTTFLFQFISALAGFKPVEPRFTGGHFPEPPEWDPYKFDKTYLEINDHEMITAHYGLNDDMFSMVNSPDVLPIYLYRDPRDAGVSAMLYIKNVLKHHCLHDLFNEISESEALLFMLCGGVINVEDKNGKKTHVVHDGMKYFCEMAYPWIDNPLIAKIRYEDLTVDPVNTIISSFNNVDVFISEEDVATVEKKLNFSTVAEGRAKGVEDKKSHFRKGIIGDYKNHFIDIHYSMCKYRLGDDLIKLGYEQDYNW